MCVWMFVLFLYHSTVRIAKERYDAVQMCVHLIGRSVLNHIQRTYSSIRILIRWANKKKTDRISFWSVYVISRHRTSHTYSQWYMSTDITNKGRIYMLVLTAWSQQAFATQSRQMCRCKVIKQNRLSFTRIDFDCYYCETISTYFKQYPNYIQTASNFTFKW